MSWFDWLDPDRSSDFRVTEMDRMINRDWAARRRAEFRRPVITMDAGGVNRGLLDVFCAGCGTANPNRCRCVAEERPIRQGRPT